MKDLNYQLKTLCKENRHGGYSTQATRRRILDRIANQLHGLGYRRMQTKSLMPELVFTYKGNRLYNMLNSAWRRARDRAGLRGFRVHDLRHTFGHRLRAAGVSYEDRQDLLGHKSERITTHYSAPDVARLIEAAEKVCVRRPNTVLRVASHTILTQSGTQKDSGQQDTVQVKER